MLLVNPGGSTNPIPALGVEFTYLPCEQAPLETSRLGDSPPHTCITPLTFASAFVVVIVRMQLADFPLGHEANDLMARAQIPKMLLHLRIMRFNVRVFHHSGASALAMNTLQPLQI